MKRRALITGITGQDGSYLAELLLEKDYEVYGLVRRTSTSDTWRIDPFIDQLKLIPGDVTDQGSLERALRLSDPQEVYNLAAQTYVAASFHTPIATGEITGLGALRLFEAVRLMTPQARIYQASSSEQYGQAAVSPQDEKTPFAPVSPYGCAKVFAHHAAVLYRKAYQQFIACGIAFNHESARRGKEFVTQKIAQGVAEIMAGKRKTLELGNVQACRDWSHAQDVVQGAWLTLQQPQPDDYVLASGSTHSVQEFADYAFQRVGLSLDTYLQINPDLYRPMEILDLVGNAEKAHQVLGWTPLVHFRALVNEMVDEALAFTRDSVRVGR